MRTDEMIVLFSVVMLNIAAVVLIGAGLIGEMTKIERSIAKLRLTREWVLNPNPTYTEKGPRDAS